MNLSFLTGIWGYVIASVFGAALSAGGTYYIVHNANAGEIASLKLAASQQQTLSVTASLDKLQGFIQTMSAAASGYQSALTGINSQYADIMKGLHNVTAQKPLPPDCKPDDSRLRNLTAAVAAANHPTNP